MSIRTAVVATAIALFMSAPAFAAEHDAASHGTTDAKAPAAAMQHEGHKGGMMGHGKGMMGVPPEKQEAVKKIQDEYKDRFFTLRQELHTKKAELEAALAQAQPDEAKAKSLAGEVTAAQGRILDLNVEMRSRIVRETGVRTPMGHMDGMMGGMMDGGMKCKMMEGHGQDGDHGQDGAKADHQQHSKTKKQ